MPDQAGTWLGSRRARRRLPQVDGYWPGPGSDHTGKGPGLAGFRIAPIRLCNRRTSPSGTRCGLPDRIQTGSRVKPGLRSCAKGRGGLATAQVPGCKKAVRDSRAFRSLYASYLDMTSYLLPKMLIILASDLGATTKASTEPSATAQSSTRTGPMRSASTVPPGSSQFGPRTWQ